MKYFLSICFGIAFCFALPAQNCSIYVNSFATGDPNVRTVYASIPLDSTQANPSLATTYTWSTGQTSNTFNVSLSGEYCVTVTFDNGCTASDCSFITVNPNGGSGNCGVTIQQSGDLPSGFLLSAYTGATGFNYLWSNGSTQSSITTNTTGNYCVTVTNPSTGCSADTCTTLFWDSTACTVSIYYNWNAQGALTAFAQGVYPIVYLWSNGSTDSSIPFPTAPGEYCVTSTDVTGCSTTACYTVNGSGGNPNCFAYLSQIQSTGGVYVSTAGGITADIIHYQWSDPTLPDTNLVFPGFDWDSLCVTVTNTTNGCISTQCIANAYKDLCLWSINCIRINSTSLAMAPFGAYGENATYLWSNGATTDTLIVTQSGTYTVTVTGTCTGVDSLTVEWTNDLSVFMFNAPMSDYGQFQAWAIQYDPAQGGILTPIASSTSDTDLGRCYFTDLPDGEYLFKAACLPGSPGYLSRMPTYYKSSLWWDQAQTIQIPSLIRSWPGHHRGIGIDFIEGQNPGGPGFVGGLVSEGANLIGHNDTENTGDPLYPGSVLIYDLLGNLVSGVSTTSDGHFAIPNLPYGTYKVVIEAAGIAPYETWITLSPSQPTVTLNIEVKDNSSALHNLSELQGFSFWPNPSTKGQITIDMPVEGNILLKNTQGKTLQSFTVASGKSLVPLTDLVPALYFLEVQTKQGNTLKKIVVK